MESLDRCFENVCELDLIFHVDKVHNILQEICMGGMVLETNMSEILSHIDAQSRLEKSESSPSSTIRVNNVYNDNNKNNNNNNSLINIISVLFILYLYSLCNL